MNENHDLGPCARPFSEELLSGYLDRTLAQGQAQRVRVHLETCDHCKALYDELQLLRESAMSTRFVAPKEEQWPELPANTASWISRSLGWVLVLSWLLVVSVFAVWRVVTQSGGAFEIFLMLGIPGGGVLLFLSVLLDRLRELKTDRYRGIQR